MAKVSIEQAKKLFGEWRKGRRGGAAFPARLRRIALRIKAQEGERVARDALGLSSEIFWRWGREEARKKPFPSRMGRKPVLKAKLPRTAAKSPPQFVEVTPTAREVRTDASVMVSFERADGARMKVGGAMDSLQIERLAERFLAGVLPS